MVLSEQHCDQVSVGGMVIYGEAQVVLQVDSDDMYYGFLTLDLNYVDCMEI